MRNWQVGFALAYYDRNAFTNFKAVSPEFGGTSFMIRKPILYLALSCWSLETSICNQKVESFSFLRRGRCPPLHK